MEQDSSFEEVSDTAPEQTQRRRGRKKSVDQVALAVTRTLRVAALDSGTRSALAMALGIGDADDTFALAYAAVSRGTELTESISAINAVANADPIEAGVMATEMAADSAAFRTAWRLLGAVTELSPIPPGAQSKAGLAMARAAQSLKPQKKDALTSLGEVLA